jgi:hypothetical protein
MGQTTRKKFSSNSFSENRSTEALKVETGNVSKGEEKELNENSRWREQKKVSDVNAFKMINRKTDSERNEAPATKKVLRQKSAQRRNFALANAM